MTELERAAPTIVFAAKGPAGNTLRAVQITMDAARLADHLDGSALIVDPGEHVFTLVADGYTTVSKKFVLREGVKGRKEAVTFKSAEPPSELAPVPVVAPVVAPPVARSESSGSGQRTVAYILGGAGVVGLGLGTAFVVSADVAHGHSKCGSPGEVCNAGLDVRAHDWLTASRVAFGVGAALVVTGVAVFLTAPKDGAVTVQPTIGASSAGVRLGGSW